MWEQLGETRLRVILNAKEHIGEILDGIDPMLLAGGDQGVEQREALPRSVVAER
jgi:hypothetical protein